MIQITDPAQESEASNAGGATGRENMTDRYEVDNREIVLEMKKGAGNQLEETQPTMQFPESNFFVRQESLDLKKRTNRSLRLTHNT